MASSRQSKLAFGIELEFLYRYPSDKMPFSQYGKEDLLFQHYSNMPDYNAVRSVSECASYVKNILVPLKLKNGVELSDDAAEVIEQKMKNKPTRPEHTKPFTTWTVTTDNSVGGPNDGAERFAPIEVISPKFTNDAAAWEQCMKVAAALKACPAISLNKTCGFHVHVGYQEKKEFELLVLKKLATLLWVGGEKALDTTHPEHRINGYYFASLTANAVFQTRPDLFPASEATTSAAGGMDESRRADIVQRKHRKPLPGPERDTRSGGKEPLNTDLEDFQSWASEACAKLTANPSNALIERFWKFPDVNNFKLAMEPGGTFIEGAYNFSHVFGDSVPAKRTIEFRQAAGTLDGQYIVAWVEVVTRLVEWAISSNRDEFGNAISRLGSSSPSLKVLLEVIGVSKKSRDHMLQRATNPRNLK